MPDGRSGEGTVHLSFSILDFRDTHNFGTLMMIEDSTIASRPVSTAVVWLGAKLLTSHKLARLVAI
jgi:hypothetical protein